MNIWLDVSSYQPNLDYSILAQDSPVKGLIIKCSSNISQPDSLFEKHIDGCERNNLRYGFYHWLDPNHNTAKQIDYFLSRANQYNYDFLAVDVEQYWQSWREWADKEITQIFTASKITQDAVTMMLGLQRLTRKPVVLYTSRSFIIDRAPSLSYYMPFMDLWLAQYPYNRTKVTTTWENFMNHYLPGSTGPDMLQNWSWKFWQFTGDKFSLPGTGGEIDVNFFNGNYRDWLEGKQEAQEPVAPPKPQAPRYEALANINIRQEPRISGKLLGKIKKGEIICPIEITSKGNETWMKIGDDQYVAKVYGGVVLFREITNDY